MFETLLNRLRISNAPTVRVYRGFGSPDCVVVMGHVFRRSPIPRRKFRQNVLVNTLALLRLFLVKPVPRATVRVRLAGGFKETCTDADGFFRVEISPPSPLAAGWHPVEADWLEGGAAVATGRNEVHVPYETPYTIISDIDDTFLISHSSNLRKRLYVLLTENAHSRDPFEGVVEHYRLLSGADTPDAEPNAFFYVSSSEWNLYDYIREFSDKNGLPKGVYLLAQLKRFGQLLKTGQGKHATKFDRIVRIIEACPGQRFILLGDDSQQDPVIYESIVRHFPGRILAVYLRHVNKKNRQATEALVAQIERAGVSVCYFEHSRAAREHSERIGLADEMQ